MAVVLNLLSVRLNGDGGRKVIERTYSVVLTGSYSGNGTTGEALDFTSATTFTNTNGIERGKFANNPTEWAVLNAPFGYAMNVVVGTALATGWGLRFSRTGSGNGVIFTEVANGAYDADIKADTGIRVRFAEPSK